MSRLIDLSGQRFGALSVVSRIEGATPTAWHCICECGKEVDVLASNLRTGKTTSCGCGAERKRKLKGKRNASWQDVSGQRFGHLVAMRYDHGRSRWFCVCDCGETCWRNITELKTRQDCGCAAAKAAGERIAAGMNGHRLGTQINTIQHIIDGHVRTNNTTGCTGVIRRGNRYQARIMVRGELIDLGRFGTIEEAAAARKAAEETYFRPIIDEDKAERNDGVAEDKGQ